MKGDDFLLVKEVAARLRVAPNTVRAWAANQRGWTKKKKVDPVQVKSWVKEAVTQDNVATVAQITKQVGEQHGAVPEQEVRDAVASLVQAGQLVAFKGKPEQKEKPAEIITGTNAVLYNPNAGDAVLTTAAAAQKGWLAGEIKGLDISGRPGAQIVVPLLSKIGSLYAKGAKSKIDLLDIIDLELSPGGTLRLTLENIPPTTAKLLGELLEVLAGVAKGRIEDGGDFGDRKPERRLSVREGSSEEARWRRASIVREISERKGIAPGSGWPQYRRLTPSRSLVTGQLFLELC